MRGVAIAVYISAARAFCMFTVTVHELGRGFGAKRFGVAVGSHSMTCAAIGGKCVRLQLEVVAMAAAAHSALW